MTNYEWLVKNNKALVKDILSRNLSRENGIPGSCSKTHCADCDFYWLLTTSSSCADDAKEWLEEEHEPLYKKGDIVIDANSQLAVVVKEQEKEGVVKISHYVDNTLGVEEDEINIKKKVGHIEESEEDG